MINDPIVRQLATLLDTQNDRETRARDAAELIRSARGYRFVAIYEVDDDRVEMLGHTGVQAPVTVHVPPAAGALGQAVRTRSTIAAGAEMVAPILGAETGIVIGALSLESDRSRGLSEADCDFAEAAALALMPLFE